MRLRTTILLACAILCVARLAHQTFAAEPVQKPIPRPPADRIQTPRSQGSAATAPAQPRGVQSVCVTPAFETAGVIIHTAEREAGLEVRVLPDGDFQRAQSFVRYDAGHMASSLFHLQPDTAYEVRVNGKLAQSFRTRKEFVLPAPKTIVDLKPGDAVMDALKQAKPGTEIRLAPGNYAGGIVVSGVKGTVEAPIVVRGLITETERKKPIQQRTLPVIEAAEHAQGIFLERCAHVVLDGLRVQHAKQIGLRLTGTQCCVVQNCQIYDNGHWNVLLSKGGKQQQYTLIQNNHVADLEHGPFGYSTKGGDGVTYYGIKRDNQAGWACVIRGNLVEGHADGISSSGDENQAAAVKESLPDVLERWPNHDVDIYDNVVMRCRDDGIETDGICVNQRVFRNYFGLCANSISISPSMPGPFWFVRNLCVDFHEGVVKMNTARGRGLIRNCYFYHNQFVRRQKSEDGRGAVLQLWDGTPSKNIVFRNNVFSSTERLVQIQLQRTHKPDIDYNLWYTSSDTNAFVWWTKPLWKKSFEAGWRGELKCDLHGTWGDPKLDPDLRPQAGSAVVDRAVVLPGINDRFVGQAPDVGAFEQVAPAR